MLAKSGSLVCPEMLEFGRYQCCYVCGASPPSEVHHEPSRGASGVTRDDLVIPLCRACHKAAGGERPVVNGVVREPLSRQHRYNLVRNFRLAFMDRATSAQMSAYAAARAAWREAIGQEIPF